MKNLHAVNSHRHDHDAKSISHALSLLNDAAKDSSEEIRDMINRDYKRFKQTLTGMRPAVKGALREISAATTQSVQQAREKIVDTTVETAKKVDTAAHERPWAFISATAAFVGLSAFLLGRRSK
ncbi:MAG: hypothetical protein AB7P04_05360 [Bacteriovoracia bacterium]